MRIARDGRGGERWRVRIGEVQVLHYNLTAFCNISRTTEDCIQKLLYLRHDPPASAIPAKYGKRTRPTACAAATPLFTSTSARCCSPPIMCNSHIFENSGNTHWWDRNLKDKPRKTDAFQPRQRKRPGGRAYPRVYIMHGRRQRASDETCF